MSENTAQGHQVTKTIHYTLQYDFVRRVWHLMGKMNADRGYCLEVDFPTEKEARDEIYYLENPSRRPKR